MCWFEVSDEPSTPVRVIQRRHRRIYDYETINSPPPATIAYSYSHRHGHNGADYRLYTPPSSSHSPSPRLSSSYTTITRTHRQRRSLPLVPVYIEERERPARMSMPTYIEYGGGGYRNSGVRIIERRGS